MKYLSFVVPILLSIQIFSQDIDYLPGSGSGQVIDHGAYTLSYDEQHEQAEWVAYKLTASEVDGRYERTDNFRRDPQVETGSASLADYKGSGYDRGHLAPAGDMSHSRRAMSRSFYLSNMTPQEAGFNRGIWRKLESQVRDWAENNGSVYVVTGGILNGSYKEEIGPNDVTVPSHYYKVILDYDGPSQSKAIAFILPNKKGTKPLKDYAVSIDQVEERTGIDFFHELPDEVERELEASASTGEWTFSSSGSYSRNYNKKQYHTDSDNKININAASKSKLDQLYGIGPAKARAIIDARPYQSVDELTRAKGIGDVTLSRIRDYITAENGGYDEPADEKASSGKININRASSYKLKSLPGIGEVLSKRIINARPFSSIHEVKDV
ncbi:MAG: DNA/RNA non-specific endonuclease, partial [Bacteroidales bacterium]|nr:DNA/RNA non-specific endonuclease [Bacteroidales bacterium]